MEEAQQKIPSFSVGQAIVALELQEPDQVILDFLAYWVQKIPMEAICFIHVIPHEDIFDITKEVGESAGEDIDEALVEMMEIRVTEALKGQEGRQIEYDIRKGDPLEVLLETTEAMSADLVVIGQAKEDRSHGILAKNLVRKIGSNSLIVPGDSNDRLNRMLVPIDFSENSARALQTAVSINNGLDVPVEIIALNAYELPNLSSYKVEQTREQFTEMFESNILDGFRAFCHTHIPNDKENVRIRLVEKEFPDTAGYILDYAREHKVDLIVTGAKGHSKVELLLLGSVTEKLMEINKEIPTLIIK